MSDRSFLDLAMIRLHEGRPKVPKSLSYTLTPDRSISQTFSDSRNLALGFRTRGCRYTHNGGCTICDYWVGDPVSSEEMVAAVVQALAKIDFEPAVMRLEVSGSFLDDWEVPTDARRRILQLLSALDHTHFVFETHATTVSAEKVLEIRELLGHRRFSIEMGLESANPWILKYIVNKHLQLDQVEKALKLLGDQQVPSVVNIMVGLPFLTPSESVADAVASVKWAFSRGAAKCVLFALNTKPWTLVAWLEEHEMFERPPSWALVDVLSELAPDELSKIGLAWYRARSQQHPAYQVPNRGPETCPLCYDEVTKLLDMFVVGQEREKVVMQLKEFRCGCQDRWRARRQERAASPLHERVRSAYQVIAEQILNQGLQPEVGRQQFDSSGIPPFRG